MKHTVHFAGGKKIELEDGIPDPARAAMNVWVVQTLEPDSVTVGVYSSAELAMAAIQSVAEECWAECHELDAMTGKGVVLTSNQS